MLVYAALKARPWLRAAAKRVALETPQDRNAGPALRQAVIAAALAQARKAALVTSDKDFARAATALKTFGISE